jgi:hypothetical protein
MVQKPGEQLKPKAQQSRKWLYLRIFAVIAVVIAGFALGRGTGEREQIEVPTGGEETPAREWLNLPPLPKETSETVDDLNNPIVIESPAESAKVPRTFSVTGRASTTMKTITATLKDDKGNVLSKADATITGAKDVFQRFSLQLSSGEYQGPARVEIESSAVQFAVRRNITIADPDTVTINAYFGKTTSDSNVVCEKVFPVSRVVSAKTGVYREAVEALLRGLTSSETALGYFTSVPTGVKIKSLAVDARGTLTIDFDNGLEKGVAGSCRVGAIRAQIETTLKQFPEVREVVIMVNGRTDDVLQP